MSHFQFDGTEINAAWCHMGDTHHTINGDCSDQRRSSMPDVPPALYSAAPISQQRLEQIVADPNYSDWGIVVYRFPADSLHPEIELIKRQGTWMVLKFRAPERYQPATRVLTPNQVIRLIFSYVVGERIFPAEIEMIGTGPSQHRIWVRLN